MHDTNPLQLITEDIDSAQQLLELIDAEYQALGQRDLPRLQEILASKLPLLSLLDQHSAVRSQFLREQQLSPDRAGLQALAARSPDGETLLARSDELNQLLSSCRDANQRNGRVIRANQASLTSVLGILRGGETPGLYDSRGGAARIGQQRPLSQA